MPEYDLDATLAERHVREVGRGIASFAVQRRADIELAEKPGGLYGSPDGDRTVGRYRSLACGGPSPGLILGGPEPGCKYGAAELPHP